MEGKNEQMLINLDSPEKNSHVVIHNHYLKNPLIPGPDLNCNELETNNPFDIVAQSAENWDPFELVLHQSLIHHERNNFSPVENGRLVDGEFSSPKDNFKLNRSNSVSNNVRFFPTPDVHYERSEEMLNISSRSLDNSPSLREKIKRVVKKRVSKCIERALSGNSSSDLHGNEPALPSKPQYSFSSHLKKKASRLAEAESGSYDLNNFLEEAKQLSIILHNISIDEEGKVSSINKNKEAPFKEDKIETKVSSNEEDLMSIKPPWDEIDNGSSDSDDNSIGLPKVKLFYMKKKDKENRNELNPEKLAHYKKRIRASIDGNMFCEEESVIPEIVDKMVESEECKLQEVRLDTKSLVLLNEGSKENETSKDSLAVNEPIVPTMNDLRPKKGGNILKKGPLKAIVPLQKMTKTIAEKMSPLKKASSYRLQKKKIEDSNLSSSLIHPVASSTPNNKNVSNNYKKYSGTTPEINKSRPRLSRKDIEMHGQSTKNRRSVSLSMDVNKNARSKQPFSFLNPNDNQKWKRPHTAPSPNSLKTNPTLKKKDVQKHSKASNIDKENQLQTY